MALVWIKLGAVPVDGPETPDVSEVGELEALKTLLVALEAVDIPVGAPVKPNPRERSILELLELLGNSTDFVVAAETPTSTYELE